MNTAATAGCSGTARRPWSRTFGARLVAACWLAAGWSAMAVAQPVESGPMTVAGSLTVNGPVRVHGALVAGGRVHATGPLTAEWFETAAVPGGYGYNGHRTFNGPLTVHGDLTVHGNLRVNGPIEVDGPVTAARIGADGPMRQRYYGR